MNVPPRIDVTRCAFAQSRQRPNCLLRGAQRPQQLHGLVLLLERGRSRDTIRAVTLRAESAGDDLVGIFRRFVADRYRPAA